MARVARKLRIQASGLHHLSIQGVAGLPIFVRGEDRHDLLAATTKLVERRGWRIYSYCLMTTHYHFLARAPEDDLGVGMKWLNGCYAQNFNKRHGRFGHVFARRYSSVFVETEPHLLEVVRYIALNPVRAGICKRPEDWPWSSYAATLGLARPARCLDPAWILGLFAGPEGARELLRRFVEDRLGDPDPLQGLTP